MTDSRLSVMRVVIDSSVLVPILTQREPITNPLVQRWQQNQINPLTNDDTLDELREVLLQRSPSSKVHQAYRFVERCLRLYIPWCEPIPLETVSSAPKCRDPSDQKFIDLAISGNAAILLTRDGDLLAMDCSTSFAIMRDSDFLRNA